MTKSDARTEIFILYTIFFVLLISLILTHSELSLTLAGNGLELWFTKMIPALLPFMILSGMMIRMGLTEHFVLFLHPVIGNIFRLSKNATYAIVMGFLCGFPMGARVTADLLERNLLDEEEANLTLAFCNHIGPVYFCSFVIPLLKREWILPYLLGMYGIPFLYGIILRHTVYRRKIRLQRLAPSRFSMTNQPVKLAATQLIATEKPKSSSSSLSASDQTSTSTSLLEVIDQSIYASLQSILMLGGYMILFTGVGLLPLLLFGKTNSYYTYLAPLLEITGGLQLLGNSAPLYSLLVLPFGGLSCIAQTYSMIKKTSLSIHPYILHKILQSALTALFYLGWYLLSTHTFLR